MIDHIGFRTTGLHDMIEHLNKLGIEFTERQVDDQGLYQLFLFDPNGVKIELNFANAEAKGRKPRTHGVGTDQRDELRHQATTLNSVMRGHPGPAFGRPVQACAGHPCLWEQR